MKKQFLEKKDVFADVINAAVFDGRQIIDPSDLVDLNPLSRYPSEADGDLHEQYRDVVKRSLSRNINLAILGVENQTSSYPFMVPKCLAYDAVSYKEQESKWVSDKKPSNYITYVVPVITVVLYYGVKDWEHPLSLYEYLGIPSDPSKEYLTKFISDYKINLVSLAKEDFSAKLHGDFGIIANEVYNVANGRSKAFNCKAQHKAELTMLLHTMFKGSVSGLSTEKIGESLESEEVNVMSEFMEQVIDKYTTEGMEKGLEQGSVNAYAKMVAMGKLSIEDGATFAGMSRSAFLKEVQSRYPDYDL